MSRKFMANAALLLLAACSSHAATDPRDGAPVDAVRVGLPESAPLPSPRSPDARAAWAGSADGASVRFGYPGGGPDLTVACRSGVLLVTRHVPAEVGAQALFALQGRTGILRLPVDATSVAGVRGYEWQGTIAADDPGVRVFEGPFDGTLPEGGRIVVPGSDLLRGVIARCRSRPATAAPVQPDATEAGTAE